MLILEIQLFTGFDVGGIHRNTVDWANLNTLAGFEVAYAFGAQLPVNLIDQLTLVDRVVWALWFAHIAIDALVGDIKSHCEAC